MLAAPTALVLGELPRTTQLASRLAVAGSDEHEPWLLRGGAAAPDQESTEQHQADGESPHCRCRPGSDNVTP